MSRLLSNMKVNIPVILVVIIVIAFAFSMLSGVQHGRNSGNIVHLKMSSSGMSNTSTQIQPQSPSAATTDNNDTSNNANTTPATQSQPSTNQSVIQPSQPVQSVGKCTACPSGSDAGNSETTCPNASCTPPALPQCPACGGFRKTMTNDAVACPMIMCAQ